MFNFKKLSQVKRPLIIAHRGASKAEHENTLEAFDASIRMGADAIEFDVRRTSDHVLVVHHNLLSPRSRRRIPNVSYDQLMREYQTKGIHLPTLEETLELCAGRISLDIELKEPGYEMTVVELTARYYDLRHVAFTSFLDSTIQSLKKSEPNAIAGLLVGMHIPARLLTRTHRLLSLSRLQKAEADFVAPNWKLVKLGFVKRMQAADMPVVIWTVDRISTARRMAELGVAGIITNRPDRIGEQLANYQL